MGGSDGKESACNVGDLGLIPVLGRSPEGGDGNPLQYSCLEKPMDRRVWWAIVHGIVKSDTNEQLTDTHTYRINPLVQLLSHVWLFATPWTAARQASLSFTISQSLLKPMSIELVMPSHHLILCQSLLLSSIFPSIRVFSSELAVHVRWPKCWSFSFSTSLANEYSGLISFRIDWFDLLAVQGTLKNLLQHHSSKPWLCFNIKKLRVWAEAFLRVCFSWNIISLILYLKLLIFKILQ